MLRRIVTVGQQHRHSVAFGEDRGFPGDGGEKRVRRIWNQESDQTASLGTQRPSNMAGLKTQALGRLEDDSFGLLADATFSRLTGKRARGCRRRNTGGFGYMLERYRSRTHAEEAAGNC